MAIGIYVSGAENVIISGNKFHDIEQPVVVRDVEYLEASGNVATYSERDCYYCDQFGFALKPLVVEIWRIFNEK